MVPAPAFIVWKLLKPSRNSEKKAWDTSIESFTLLKTLSEASALYDALLFKNTLNIRRID